MALTIGAINFEVDAQTRGLQKAVQQLRQFQKVVDATAKSQAQGAAQTAAALGRQESAIKRAFQQTLNLRRALLQNGSKEAAAHLRLIEQALFRFTNEMTSGELSTIQFSRSLDALNARLNRSSRALKDLNAAARNKEVSRFTEVMRDLESAAVLGLGPLSGLGARIRSLGAIVTRSNIALAAFLGTIVGVTTGLGMLIASSVKAEVAFEQMEARFLSSNDSQEAARQEMTFVVKTARQLALRITDLGKSYSRLTAASAGTALEGKGTRDIFLGVAKAAASLRLESTEVEGIFRAVEQMISKGNVQAEELRGQMGERLPGAFRRAADAMGMTTRELSAALKAGTVMADDFLPKLAAELEKVFGPTAEKNTQSFVGAVNNLSNSWLLFNREFDKTFRVTQTVTRAINNLSGILDFLRENLHDIARALGGVIGGMIALTAPAILRGGIFLAETLALAAKAMGALNIAMLTNPAGKLAQAFVKLGSVVVGATAGMLAMEMFMEDVESLLGDIGSAMDNLGKGDLNLTDKFEDLKNKIDETRQQSLLLMQALNTGNVTDVFAFDALTKAREELRKLNNDEIMAIEEHLASIMPNAVGTTEERLAALFSTNARLSDSFQKLRRQIEATPEVMREITDEFDILRGRIDAMNRGSRAVELFEREVDRVKALERMRDQLERMFTSEEHRNEVLNEYNELLKQLQVAQDNFTGSGADMAAAITRGLESIITRAQDAGDVLRALGDEVVRIALRAFALKPLENALSSFFGNIGAGAATNATGPVNTSNPAAPSAKGNAFRNGRIQPFKKGGIVGSPTFFGMANGGMGVAGEAGTEAILPLRRMSNGDLGVQSSGSGGVVVNVYDMRRGQGSRPVEVRERNSGGFRELDIFIRDTIKDAMNTGELDATLGRNFGLTRKGVR